MAGKKVLVVLAHSPSTSFGVALGKTYANTARDAGHEIKIIHLHDLRYDPVLHAGYQAKQALEPDLLAAQDAVRWANHVTFVYPIWWGGLPALLKGFIDRVFLPGFAFKYEKGQPFPEKLLKGRSAHILATMDSPPWYYHLIGWAPGLRQMKKLTLEFCGIEPVKTLSLGPILHSSSTQRERWLRKARSLATEL